MPTRAAATLILALLLTAGTTRAADAPPTPPAPQPVPPKFLIGVWYQPASSFDKWKARGINTLFGYESEGNSVPRDQWTDAARKAGLSYIVKPTGDPDDAKADAADPYCLAWEQTDEPDGAGNVSPDAIVATYQQWKTLAPNKPVLLNFDGWKMQWRPRADYERYVQGGDWLAFDYYVINRGEGPDAIKKLGDRLDTLRQLTAGKKKLLVFIECSDQDLKQQDWTKQNDATGTPLAPKMRPPTPDEMRREVEVSIAHGAAGIVYFPDVIGKGWSAFDGVTPDLEAAMKQINTKLATANGQRLPPPSTGPSAIHPDAHHRPDAPLDGTDITIDGVTYTLHKKQTQ